MGDWADNGIRGTYGKGIASVVNATTIKEPKRRYIIYDGRANSIDGTDDASVIEMVPYGCKTDKAAISYLNREHRGHDYQLWGYNVQPKNKLTNERHVYGQM